MSTCAITPSTCTRVTRPTNRLRALESTSLGSLGAAASSTARAASASPGISGRRTGRGQDSLIDPATHGVVAHAEQPCGLGDLVGGHGWHDITASAGSGFVRICGELVRSLRPTPPLAGGDRSVRSREPLRAEHADSAAPLRRLRRQRRRQPPVRPAGRSLDACPFRRWSSRSTHSTTTSACARRGTRASRVSANSASAASRPRTSPSSAREASDPRSCWLSPPPASARSRSSTTTRSRHPICSGR